MCFLVLSMLKSLKLRYVLMGRRAEIESREGARPGFLAQPLYLRLSPDGPVALSIYEATYGPRGSGTYDKEGVVDVTERVCGM